MDVLKGSIIANGVTLIKPEVDASESQVLFQNNMFNLGGAYRQILLHADATGLNKDFDLPVPKFYGKINNSVKVMDIGERFQKEQKLI